MKKKENSEVFSLVDFAWNVPYIVIVHIYIESCIQSVWKYTVWNTYDTLYATPSSFFLPLLLFFFFYFWCCPAVLIPLHTAQNAQGLHTTYALRLECTAALRQSSCAIRVPLSVCSIREATIMLRNRTSYYYKNSRSVLVLNQFCKPPLFL